MFRMLWLHLRALAPQPVWDAYSNSLSVTMIRFRANPFKTDSGSFATFKHFRCLQVGSSWISRCCGHILSEKYNCLNSLFAVAYVVLVFRLSSDSTCKTFLDTSHSWGYNWILVWLSWFDQYLSWHGWHSSVLGGLSVSPAVFMWAQLHLEFWPYWTNRHLMIYDGRCQCRKLWAIYLTREWRSRWWVGVEYVWQIR